MHTYKEYRQLHQALGIVLWYIFENAKIPPGAQRLQLCNAFRMKPAEGAEVISKALMELVAHSPTDPTLAINLLVNGPERMGRALHRMIVTYLDGTEGLIFLQVLPIWAGLGFPTVQMDGDFINRLLRVRLSEEQIDQTPLPFEAFNITLPEKMFFSKNAAGKLLPLETLLVGPMKEVFGSPGAVESGYGMTSETDEFSLWSCWPTISGMGNPQNKEEPPVQPDDHPTDLMDKQTIRLFVQLIGHVAKIAARRGLIITEGNPAPPNFEKGIMPSFQTRVFHLGPSDLPG